MQRTTLYRRFSIYAELFHHRRLAERRSLFHGKNQTAKIILSITGIFILIYLLILAISLALLVSKDQSVSPTGVLFSLTPFLFTIDFLLRFIAQQTPAQMIKPYSLLPLPRHACIESFLISNLLCIGNFIWQVMIIPYSIMAILPREGLIMALGSIIAFQFVIWLSSLFYLLVRTRITDSVFWIVLPLIWFAILALPLYGGKNAGWDQYFNFYSTIGKHIARINVIYWLGLIGIITIFFFINRKEQESHVIKELSKQSTTNLQHISEYRLFNRFGMIGEYIKMEFKLVFRNKNPRKTLLLIIFYIFFNFLLYLFTDIKGSEELFSWKADFWCFICFIIPGGILSSRLMSYEGNYMDFYMIHKNNLYQLLLTKYYCYLCLLSLSIFVSVIALVLGKWSLLMIIAYTLYTAGPNDIMVLHAAIINDQTTPLDTKLISRTNNSYNYVTMLIQFGAILLPVIIIAIFRAIFNSTIAYWALILFSIPFILSHKWWIQQIYRKMMTRKYEHLENFRASK